MRCHFPNGIWRRQTPLKSAKKASELSRGLWCSYRDPGQLEGLLTTLHRVEEVAGKKVKNSVKSVDYQNF